MARGALNKVRTGWRGQIYLGKRPDGREIRRSKTFRLVDGYDHTIEGRRRAERAMADWVDTQTSSSLAAETVTLGQLMGLHIDRAIEGRGDRSANTVDTYRWSEKRVAASGLADKPICDLKVRDIEWYLEQEQQTGLAKSSLTRLKFHIKKALDHAIREEWLIRNVATLAVVPDAPKPEQRSLTVDQAKALLVAARGHRLEAAVIAGLGRGLRPGEILGLRWEDVDLEARTLRIEKALKHRKGELWLGDPKTPKSKRTLRLPQVLADSLVDHWARQEVERSKARKRWDDTHDVVFATRTGTLMDPANFRREFRNICRRADIGDDWTPRQMRHSAMSILSAAGVPLHELIDLGGWTDERMLHRHYRQQLAQSVDAGSSAIDDVFGS